MGDIGGVTAIGTNNGTPRIESDYPHVSDDVSYTRGRHSLKYGFVWNYFQDHTPFLGFDKVFVSFANVANFYDGLSGATSGIPPSTNFVRVTDMDTMGFYGQDAWRVTPRLTLNLGMRYEPIDNVL